MHTEDGLGNKRKWGYWEEWCTWRRVVDQGQSLGGHRRRKCASGDLAKTTCCSRSVGLRTGGRYITADTQSETDWRITEPPPALLPAPCRSRESAAGRLSIKCVETCLGLVLSADEKQMDGQVKSDGGWAPTGDKIKARRPAGSGDAVGGSDEGRESE